MLIEKPIRRIADLVARDPAHMVPILDRLLPKDKRSKRKDKAAKIIANLPGPVLARIIAELERLAGPR